jgi:hypothetical protein
VLQRSFDAARHELGQVTMADLIDDVQHSPSNGKVQRVRGGLQSK